MSTVYEPALENVYRIFAVTNLTTDTSDVFATNGVSNSAPSGNNILPISFLSNASPNGVILKPFAVATNGQTATCNIYNWKRAFGVASVTSDSVYIRTLLFQIVCTFSSSYQSPITSANVIGTTPLFASSITMATGFGIENIDYYFQGLPAEVFCDIKSPDFLEIAMVSGNATSVNFFVQKV